MTPPQDFECKTEAELEAIRAEYKDTKTCMVGPGLKGDEGCVFSFSTYF